MNYSENNDNNTQLAQVISIAFVVLVMMFFFVKIIFF